MKKLIELLKKLLGSSSSTPTGEQKGFTLIELMIVIAILGILAAAILAAIDPIDKIQAGNDTKAVGDVREIYDGALRAYAINNAIPVSINGAVPSVVSTGELKVAPVPPTGYATPYGYFVNGAGTDAIVCTQVKSKAQRNKAQVQLGGAVPATAYLVFTNAKACYSAAACNAGSTCP